MLAMHSVERKCNRNSVWFCVDDVIKVGGTEENGKNLKMEIFVGLNINIKKSNFFQTINSYNYIDLHTF